MRCFVSSSNAVALEKIWKIKKNDWRMKSKIQPRTGWWTVRATVKKIKLAKSLPHSWFFFRKRFASLFKVFAILIRATHGAFTSGIIKMFLLLDSQTPAIICIKWEKSWNKKRLNNLSILKSSCYVKPWAIKMPFEYITKKKKQMYALLLQLWYHLKMKPPSIDEKFKKTNHFPDMNELRQLHKVNELWQFV